MPLIPWHLCPRIELRRFRKIEFFPPHPGELSALDSICIGSKTRTIGDALMLSTLPAKLKTMNPKLKITIYPRGFNPVVFYGNPSVSGVNYLPRTVHGDDDNAGSGHLIQLKERFFGMPVSDPPRPEIHLLESERSAMASLLRAKTLAGNEKKPLLILHPWGHTWKQVLTLDRWEALVERWSPRYRIWQVGVEGQQRIAGCEHHFLTPRAFRHARTLFALLNRASAFIGVNSGPMHVARAFDVPSAILTEQGNLDRIFELRRKHPYYLHGNWAHAFLYESNLHLDVPQLSHVEFSGRIDSFLESALSAWKAQPVL